MEFQSVQNGLDLSKTNCACPKRQLQHIVVDRFKSFWRSWNFFGLIFIVQNDLRFKIPELPPLVDLYSRLVYTFWDINYIYNMHHPPHFPIYLCLTFWKRKRKFQNNHPKPLHEFLFFCLYQKPQTLIKHARLKK